MPTCSELNVNTPSMSDTIAKLAFGSSRWEIDWSPVISKADYCNFDTCTDAIGEEGTLDLPFSWNVMSDWIFLTLDRGVKFETSSFFPQHAIFY